MTESDKEPVRWAPITQAVKECQPEILGVIFRDGQMVKEPFLSFWSPTLGRWYCNPTHYISLPASPIE